MQELKSTEINHPKRLLKRIRTIKTFQASKKGNEKKENVVGPSTRPLEMQNLWK